MAPGRGHDRMAMRNGFVTYSDASTDATSIIDKCPCCGQLLEKRTCSQITPTRRDSFFEPEKPLRHQPQDLTKTYHWKKKNVPKF